MKQLFYNGLKAVSLVMFIYTLVLLAILPDYLYIFPCITITISLLSFVGSVFVEAGDVNILPIL